MPPAFLAMAGAQVVGGLITAYQTNRASAEAASRARQFEQQLSRLEANRQEIIDPSAAIQDRSSIIQNQYSNLQVATQAAKFQAEEADLSLANTLDALRATGAGAGGATALATAALRSKRDISATIQQQEANNIQLRAQGAQMAQAARLQEGARTDAARMAGQQFMFGVREQRETAQMDRTASLADQQAAIARANRQASQAALAGAFGAATGGALGAYFGAPAPSGGSSTANASATQRVGGTDATPFSFSADAERRFNESNAMWGAGYNS